MNPERYLFIFIFYLFYLFIILFYFLTFGLKFGRSADMKQTTLCDGLSVFI